MNFDFDKILFSDGGKHHLCKAMFDKRNGKCWKASQLHQMIGKIREIVLGDRKNEIV